MSRASESDVVGIRASSLLVLLPHFTSQEEKYSTMKLRVKSHTLVSCRITVWFLLWFVPRYPHAGMGRGRDFQRQLNLEFVINSRSNVGIMGVSAVPALG